MQEITLPDEIQQIIWKRVYSDNLVSSISKQATLINKNLQNLYLFYKFALEPQDY